MLRHTQQSTQGERFGLCYCKIFPFVLSQSKHKKDLNNSPLYLDICSIAFTILLTLQRGAFLIMEL